MKLHSKVLLACVAAAVAGGAVAQAALSGDELIVGPINVPRTYQGVTVTPVVTSYFKLATRADGLHLNARVESDLRDLQNKFSALIDTMPLPRDNCRSFSGNNPVVSLSNKQLKAEGKNGRIVISGEVKLWDCRENPVPQVYWDPTGCKGKIPIINKEYSFGCPKTRPGSPIKNVLLTQPFDFAVPVSLQRTGDRSISLVIGDPKVELGGQLAFITKGVLSIAGVDINAEAKKAIEASVDPNSLTVSIPSEYAELNPLVEGASFGEKGGNLTAIVEMTARIPAAKMNDLIRSMVDGVKPQP
jgi:hypothetical protein